MTIKQEIEALWAKKIRLDQSIRQDDRVLDLIDHIRDEKKHLFDKIDAEIAELEKQRKPQRPKTPRWPVDCPEAVIKACTVYWSGTSEAHRFRIHAWNAIKVITSYPGGSLYNRMGSEYCSPEYHMIELSKCHSDNCIKSWSGRLSKKEMADALAEQ